MLDVEIDEAPVLDWRGYTMNYQPVKGGLVVTDAEIEQAAYMEWLDIITGMWEAIGKPIDEKRLPIYARELRGIPLGLLERAISRAIRNAGDYLVVPTISAIWGSLRRELGNPLDIDEAIERWCEVQYQSRVRRFK